MAIKINERSPGTSNANTIVFGDNQGQKMDFQYFGTNIRLRCGIRCTSLTRNEPAYNSKEPEGMTKIDWNPVSYGEPTIKATVGDSMATGSLSLFTRQGGAVKANLSEIFIRSTASGPEVFVNETPFPKTDCKTCKGTSVLLCPKCNGQGRFARKTMFGTMWDKCYDCDGYGVKMCKDCDQKLISRALQDSLQRLSDFILDQGVVGAANLQGTQLANADLSGIALHSVNLKDANLQQAKLDGADLTNADLSGANLTGASLNKAKLENAIFDNASMAKAQLEGAICLYTSFKNANLTEANFKKALFADVEANGANLTKVDFTGSKVKEDYWEGTELDGDWVRFDGIWTDDKTNKADVIGWPSQS